MDKKMKIQWKQVRLDSIKYFRIIIDLYLLAFVLYSVGQVIILSILVEVALVRAFTNFALMLHIILPFASIGGISLAFITQWRAKDKKPLSALK